MSETQLPTEPSRPRFCRRCGYDLRESADRCPECGRGFDPENPRTYRAKPPLGVGRWIKRVAIALAIAAIAYGGFVGWLWWGWRAEQKALIALGSSKLGPSGVDRSKIGRVMVSFPAPAYPLAEKLLPRRLHFLNGRATSLSMRGMGGLLTIKGDTEAAELEHFPFLQTIMVEKVTDAGMAHLRELTRLKRLFISESPQVTGKSLAHLSAMAQLKELTILDTSVDDEGLYYLRNLKQLELLNIDKSRLAGIGFQHLSELQKLTMLWLSDSSVTDAGLQQIVVLKGLRSLDLPGAQISDAGVEYVESLNQLSTLGLSGTRIRGPGLAHLTKMTRIARIDLSNTPLTDAAVEPLIRVLNGQQPDPRVRTTLRVDKTQMTAEGVSRLRTACPNVRIYSDYDP